MIAPRLQRQITDRYRKRINRAPSQLLGTLVPVVSIMLASMSPMSPLIVSAPIMPPLGLCMMLAWTIVRPGLIPVWAGFPLGAFDDLYSGQPFGSGILLWSAVLIGMNMIEQRFPWRTFLQDWLSAIGLISASILFGVLFANAAGAATPLRVVGPQLLITALTFPLIARIVAMLDRFRLLPIRSIG